MKVLEPQEKPRRANLIEGSADNKQINCLITGFDAFGGRDFNSSEAVLELLPDSIKLPKRKALVDLRALVLPSSGRQSWEALQTALAALPPKEPLCLVLTGEAVSRSVVTIERFALNVRDYRIKDNGGETWEGERVVEGEPEALRTGADVQALVRRLMRKGFPAAVSNHAGTFVCNEIYYRALLACSASDRPYQCVFVHIPSPPLFGRKIREAGIKHDERHTRGLANQLKLLRDAVVDLTSALSEMLLDERANS